MNIGKNMRAVKLIGYVATGLGAIASIVGTWVTERSMDNKITEAVTEQISKLGANIGQNS